MSNAPLFPREEEISQNSESAGEEKTPFKRPEFILIDDRSGKSQYTHFGADSSRKPGDASQEQSAKKPTSLRFICLLGFIFCLVFGTGIFLWSIVMTFLATLSLFQKPALNKGVRTFWKIFANTFVAGFGFTLGMMSPTVGLGLLAIYFSLASDLADEDILRKVIRSSFKNF